VTTTRKVLIVVNSADGGGAEKSMRLLSENFLHFGLNSTLVFINDYPDLNRTPGIRLGRKYGSGPIKTLNTIRVFSKVVKDLKPDILLLNCELPELFGSIIRHRDSQVVVIEHSPNPWVGRQYLGCLVRLILRMRKVSWVSVGKYIRNWDVPKNQISYIPNIVAKNGSTAYNDTHISHIPLKRIVFVGRLSAEKNPFFALRVAQKLSLPIIFIGIGKLQEDLKSKANKLSMNCTFLGFLETPWEQFQLGDLLLVPSHYEGDGLVVYEALLHNIPLIVSDILPFRTLLLPELNYSRSELDCVQKLSAHRNSINYFKTPLQIRERVLAERDSKNVVLKWLKFFESLD
jgi:glycosyltransferase involved in cell wall biosynthesis